MSERSLAFLYSSAVDQLSYPPECPFKTQRAGLTRLKLKSLGLLEAIDPREIAARPATREELTRFHSPRYLEVLQQAAAGELGLEGLEMGLGGADTPIFKDLFVYGSWACGAALNAADLLLLGKADVAFSLLGGFHHAMAAKASGFCYLNDAVLACDRLARFGKRVLYLDVDAHHGDGVQEAFYQRGDVFTVSVHETGKTLFPWGGFENETGEGAGAGSNLNVPLPAGSYDEAFVTVLDQVITPLLDRVSPEVVVLELGMDTLAGDPLTHLHMTNNVVVEVLNRLLRFGCPLLVLGGGGYHVENTVRGWALAWRTCSNNGEEDVDYLGMGGVMLGSNEWAGGLRDPEQPVSAAQRQAVEPALNATIEAVRAIIFRQHGHGSPAAEGKRAAVGP